MKSHNRRAMAELVSSSLRGFRHAKSFSTRIWREPFWPSMPTSSDAAHFATCAAGAVTSIRFCV